MHGTSHSIGLDVHDVGVIKPNGEDDGRLLEPGMVLTVEPGCISLMGRNSRNRSEVRRHWH